VRRQLVAHFPDAVLAETTAALASRWRPDVPAFVVDFGLSETFMRPLRALPSFATDPLTGLAGALSDLVAGALGVIPVLLQATRIERTHPDHERRLRRVGARRGCPCARDTPERDDSERGGARRARPSPLGVPPRGKAPARPPEDARRAAGGCARPHPRRECP